MKKGFTLIELLVIIAIIGILSGIVLTSLNGGSERSQEIRDEKKQVLFDCLNAFDVHKNDFSRVTTKNFNWCWDETQ